MNWNNLDVSLFGTNLTNQDNVTYAAPASRVWRLRPRVVGAELRYSF